MKYLYIIPGHGETEKMRKYQKIKSLAKKLDYTPVVISVDWEGNKSIQECVRVTEKQIKHYGSTEQSTILGFSFGACILALLLKKVSFKKAIFCSISPYFKEDMSLWPEKEAKETRKYFRGDRFAQSLMKESFPIPTEQPVVFLVGSKEGAMCISRAQRSLDLWKGTKELFVILHANHNIGNVHYLKQLRSILRWVCVQ
ncbi:MAG: hypothetical protein AAB447_01445 [Patescibacteria group bacterium]